MGVLCALLHKLRSLQSKGLESATHTARRYRTVGNGCGSLQALPAPSVVNWLASDGSAGGFVFVGSFVDLLVDKDDHDYQDRNSRPRSG